MRHFSGMILTGLTTILLAGPAAAKSPEEKILEPFEKCQKIEDNNERLACFDSAVGRAQGIAVSQRDERRQRQKEDFGLSDLQIEDREKRDSETNAEAVKARKAERQELEPDQITATLSDVFANLKTGKRVFLLDNGQLWRETSGSGMRRTPKAGATVTVSKASLGGFRLRVEGKRGFVNVKRIR